MNSKFFFTNAANLSTLRKCFTYFLIVALCVFWIPSHAFGVGDICITDFDWVPGTPTIDGRVSQDPGWANAAEVNLGVNTGANENSVVAQVLKDSSFVYLSFDVRSLSTLNSDDVIVLCFAPDGNQANDWRFHIFPFGPSGETNTIVAGAPFSVTTWRGTGSGTWGSGVTSLNTEWPIANARVHKYGVNSNWSIEIKIPHAATANAALANGVFFNPDGVSTLKMYMNVLRTSGGLPGVAQAPWPAGVGVDTGGPAEEGTPARTAWADVSLHSRPACTGVSIQFGQSTASIGTTNPVTSDIRLHRPGGVDLTLAACPPPSGQGNNTSVTNVFYANVENNMQNPVPANAVQMEYRIHDWGIPPLNPAFWTKIPAPVNPITNSGPIPVTGGIPATGLFNMNWAPTFQQSCTLLAGNTHQCMLVIMSSPDPAVRFLNNGTRRNLDFVNTSLYRRKATISARGYGPAPNGRATHRFALAVQKEIENCTGERSTGQMTWTVRGYRETGQFIIIRGKKYPVFDEVGAFGYIARHAGPVQEWRDGISGGGIKKLNDNTYTLEIPPEGEVVVDTFVESVDGKDRPVEPDPPNEDGFKRWGLSLHAGASFLHGNLNNVFNAGPNFAFDLEYRINKMFSLEGIYGFHHFRGDTIGPFSFDNMNVHQFSLNGKVYGSTSPVRPFFNFGGGAYRFQPDTTVRGGLNFGGGLQFDVKPKVAVEGVYNFHNIFTSGSNTRFSAVQGGMRFRF